MHTHTHTTTTSRWRTALILRELEQEVDALARGRPHRAKLKELMAKKVRGRRHVP